MHNRCYLTWKCIAYCKIHGGKHSSPHTSGSILIGRGQFVLNDRDDYATVITQQYCRAVDVWAIHHPMDLEDIEFPNIGKRGSELAQNL